MTMNECDFDTSEDAYAFVHAKNAAKLKLSEPFHLTESTTLQEIQEFLRRPEEIPLPDGSTYSMCEPGTFNAASRDDEAHLFIVKTALQKKPFHSPPVVAIIGPEQRLTFTLQPKEIILTIEAALSNNAFAVLERLRGRRVDVQDK